MLPEDLLLYLKTRRFCGIEQKLYDKIISSGELTLHQRKIPKKIVLLDQEISLG